MATNTPYGLLDTLTSQFKAKELVKHVLEAKPSFVKELEKVIVTKREKSYYTSEKNLLRSLNIYYSHSVMGKAKYSCNQKANKNKENVPNICLLYTSPSPRDATLSRMPSSA